MFNVAHADMRFPLAYVLDARFAIGIADVEPNEADYVNSLGPLRGGSILLEAGEAADRLEPLGVTRRNYLLNWLADRGVTGVSLNASTTLGAAFIRMARAIIPGITAEWFLDHMSIHPNRRR